MECAYCRSTFSRIEDPEFRHQRAAIIDERHQHGCCQAFVSSDHSVGAVGSEEVLTRILVSPFHVDRKKGRLTKSAVTAAETSGLSVIREALATDEEIRRTAEELVQKARASGQPKVGIFGVAKITCGSVRSFVYSLDFFACYCVYDTALQKSPAHAELFQRVHNQLPEIIADRRKYFLEGISASQIETVEAYRNGLLKDLAPT